MNCFEFRKMALASPKEMSAEGAQHKTACPACAAFAVEISRQDDKLLDAMQVPIPEGLVGRVLLAQQRKSRGIDWKPWALAASVVIVAGLAFSGLQRETTLPAERIADASALTRDHPAIAAIGYVLEHESRLLAENKRGDPEIMHASLQKLGIHLPAKATVEYLGKCPVPGGTGDHLVVNTDAGKVTLILVTDQTLGARVMVAYRDKTAVAASLRQGGYIVIADSAATVQQLERKFM